MSIEINKLAPDFKLMGSDGKEHSLSDYKGKNIVLYFYKQKEVASKLTNKTYEYIKLHIIFKLYLHVILIQLL